MSRIDDLINELCPDGVPFQPLGALGSRNKGTSMTATRMREIDSGGPVRVFAGGSTVADVDEASVPAKAVVRDPSIIVKSRGHIGFTYYDRPFSHKSELWSYTLSAPTVNQRFIYYYLLTRTRNLQDLARATSVKLPQLSVSDTDGLKVPVPPLEVQDEIVRILDTFSALTAELEAELEARRTQYEYYRDTLLTFADGLNHWVKFGDIATIVRGASPRPIRSFITNESSGVPWIKIGDVPVNGKFITATQQKVTPGGAAKSRYVRPGDFVLSNSMSFGRPYISQIEGCIHDGWLAIQNFEATFRHDFLYHLLRSNAVYQEMAAKASSGTVRNLNADIVKSLNLPVPSLDEQDRVVEILDGFESLTNDLSFGLPAEIEARRKQYEYYRDRLLSFEEAPA